MVTFPNQIDPITTSSISAFASRGHGFTLSQTGRDGDWIAEVHFEEAARNLSDADCPAIGEIVMAFAELPDIRPGPEALQRFPVVRPIPPTTMDGAVWTLQTAGYAPDGTDFALTIQGDQGPFANWASSAARALAQCAATRDAAPAP